MITVCLISFIAGYVSISIRSNCTIFINYYIFKVVPNKSNNSFEISKSISPRCTILSVSIKVYFCILINIYRFNIIKFTVRHYIGFCFLSVIYGITYTRSSISFKSTVCDSSGILNLRNIQCSTVSTSNNIISESRITNINCAYIIISKVNGSTIFSPVVYKVRITIIKVTRSTPIYSSTFTIYSMVSKS